MKLHPKNQFSVNYKKQILLLQLVAFYKIKQGKFKSALKSNYTAQTLVADVDESSFRNLDYLVAINTLTAYLLLMI